MSKLEYPQRRRCACCRGALGNTIKDPVLFGKFCSPRCAGIPVPASRPDQAPRECRTERDGHAVFKRRYRCEAEIPQKLRDDPAASFYRCQHCGHLHIGHSRIDLTTGMTRALSDRSQIAEVLVKARGKATIKDVAGYLKVPQARVREWEDPGFSKPDAGVLFSLLEIYRLRLAVLFPGA